MKKTESENASIVGASAFRNKGAMAEERAAQFLLSQGLAVIKRNHRCRQGEVDLVCRQGPLVIFVEVRQRAPRSKVTAAESIDAFKQARIRHAALHYLSQWAFMPPCRFDAVLLEGERIQWVQNIME